MAPFVKLESQIVGTATSLHMDLRGRCIRQFRQHLSLRAGELVDWLARDVCTVQRKTVLGYVDADDLACLGV